MQLTKIKILSDKNKIENWRPKMKMKMKTLIQ